MTDIIYATTNPGKFSEVQKICAHHNVNIKSLADFGIDLDVNEAGDTLESNAKIKALAYQKLLPTGTMVIADDTGVEIDALDGEPGIKVRRWKGYPMQDEEIIEYCVARMKDIPEGKRGAQFRTVLAIIQNGSPVKYFDGILRGQILKGPLPARREGMPFWPLFYDPKLQMTLGQIHDQPLEFQLAHPTHRERAITSALPYLISLFQ